MLNAIVSNSLRARVLVLALAVVLLGVGFQQVRHAPLDVFPEFAPPRVEIQTEAPGLSTEEVETLITLPIEQSLSGQSWLASMRSKSVLGLSSVALLFNPGTDLMQARQLVQERLLAVAPRLPAVAKPPQMLAPLSSLSRVLKIGMTSPKLDPMELTDIAMWTLRPRLMSVPGVANVAIWGARERQLQVLVDPDRLAAHGISLEAVVRAAGDATVLGAGGFVDTPTQRLPVRHASPVTTAADLARTVVAFRDGVPLRLGDVAEVVTGHAQPIGDAVINDGPGLLLVVEKHPWGNTLEVTREVEKALEALKPGMKDVVFDSTIFRPASFIEISIHNLTRALLLGCGMVVLVLVLFLFDWRAAFISLTAIPLSIAAASLLLWWQGGTINVLVLAGLVIAVGEVVDDAIIDVENIRRRLHLNRTSAAPKSPFQVVLDASLEVRSSVVFASLIVVMVFVPVLLLPGLSGTMFRPLALAYISAIGASLLVALTVTPALCLVMLPTEHPRRTESPLAAALKRAYRAVLPWMVARPRVALTAALLAFGGAGAAVFGFGEEFLPVFKEQDFVMHWVEKPGTSLEAAKRATIQVGRELRAVPGVRNLGAHIGRAEVADEVVGPNFTELWISVARDANYDATIAKVGEVIAGYPGLQRDLQPYLSERIEEVLSGASAEIVVRLFGPDLALLRAKARDVHDAIKDVPGVTDLKIEAQTLVPHVQIRLRPEVAANLGLTPAAVRQAAMTLVKGRKVGEVFEAQKISDVAVWSVERLRGSTETLRLLPIETPAGTLVPLGDVADIEILPTPNEIKREGGSRRLDVLFNVKGRDLGGVAREVEQRVKALDFPREHHPEFLGLYLERQSAQRRLLLLTALALAGILVLLHLDFGSWRLTCLVAFTLPFALVGGVAAGFIAGEALSLGSLVGFVTVLGIAARNGIMLVSHYRHLQEHEGEPFGLALVLRGAEERLSPILMTAACAGLALLPLIIAGNIPGHEIEYPMAWVILGGLVTSTVMNLFLLPALYLAFAGVGRPAQGAN